MFLDVVESVSVLISAKGQVLRSEISGVVKMRVYLTGMPELRLGLNDKVLFESTGRGSDVHAAAPCDAAQRARARRSSWRTSSSTSACACRASTPTAPSPSSRRTASSTSCRTD